jgi:hypothetical protein
MWRLEEQSAIAERILLAHGRGICVKKEKESEGAVLRKKNNVGMGAQGEGGANGGRGRYGAVSVRASDQARLYEQKRT